MVAQNKIGINELQHKYNDWWHEKEQLFPPSSMKKKGGDKNYRKIIRCLYPLEDGLFLDVCCGNGTFLSFLEQNTRLSLYGVDISGFAIESAGSRLQRAKVCVGDAQDINCFENNYFDYVTCLGSIEHLPNPSKGIKEISRVLKTNGKALIIVPNLFFLGHIYMAFKYGVYPSEGQQEFSEMFSTVEGWKELLTEGGLEIIRVYKYNEIGATKKVGRPAIVLWNIFKAFIPISLSYSFIFICKPRRAA
ncbi:MAG: class I SAM-dependent methyltransferase [Candidatus Omnitrophota bacterium]